MTMTFFNAFTLTFLLSATALLTGCSSGPRAFPTPTDAVNALTESLRADDTAQLLAIVGSEGKEVVSSGDAADDRIRRQKFVEMYDQKHALVPDADGRQTLTVGNDDWPFPIPLVKQRDQWVFDVAAGKEELVNRRVGENELAAIEVVKAIGDAQHEYALRHRGADGVREYARKFASDPGQRNGLYWPAGEGEKPSPLGEMVVGAAAEGYRLRDEGRTPYHGYFYRILESQGPGAPGGAVDYVASGKMVLGFAVLAWPADYGSSGVMSFLMGSDGIVHQRDLGEDTGKLAETMIAYDPSDGWAKATE